MNTQQIIKNFSSMTAYEKVTTLRELENEAVNDKQLWPTVIGLFSQLPAVLAASVVDGTQATDKAHDCFCNSLQFRGEYENMKKRDKLNPVEVETLFTAMIQHHIQIKTKEQPEKNYFA